MNELYSFEAEITLIPKEEGGRETIPSLTGSYYKPNIVVGDPNQRQAVIVKNFIQETYLSIAFESSENDVEFNKPFLAELAMIHYPDPPYDSLVPDTTFTLREGPNIIGFGRVKSLPAPLVRPSSRPLGKS